jgi:plasmid stabilization system protein ParE
MRKIDWAPSAIADLKGIRNFIARDSEAYSNYFVRRLIEVVENVASYSMMGRKMPEALDENIRELCFRNIESCTELRPPVFLF